jgi:hypothetical protein
MGGRSAFADKAAEAAALPDEAAAEVLSPSSSVKFGDFAVGSDPAGTAGSKAAAGLLEKQGSASLQQQQPLQPQPPNKPPSDVVLVKVGVSRSSKACPTQPPLCTCEFFCKHIIGGQSGTCAQECDHAPPVVATMDILLRHLYKDGNQLHANPLKQQAEYTLRVAAYNT